MSRQINQAGLDLIKNFEGLRLQAYICPGGIWTIGYGHTKDVRPGQYIKQSQAEVYLRQDLERFEAAVERIVRYPLTDNQFAAVVSLTFNIGEAALARSTIAKYLNQGMLSQAALQFDRWVYAGGKKLQGLVRRRRAEQQLFLKK